MPAATEVLENRGPWLSTAMALFLAWSIMMMVVRAWAKLRTKQWALDDYVLTGALVSLLHFSFFPFQPFSIVLCQLDGR